MQLRSGTRTNSLPIMETTSSIEIIYDMVDEMNNTNSQFETIELLTDLYRYLHQRMKYFMQPKYKNLVDTIIEKSQEFKEELVEVIQNNPDTMDELSNNAYRLYYYIESVTKEFSVKKTKT